MLICKSCLSGCCRVLSINMTGYDMLKIHNILDLKFSLFAEIVLVDNEANLELYKEQYALFKFTDDDCRKYYRFSLKKMDGEIIYGLKKCVFMQEIAGDDLNIETGKNFAARCGIYDFRPLACAVFPAKLTDENGGVGLITDYSTRIEKSLELHYNLCPTAFKREDYINESEEILKNLVKYSYELYFFKSIAENWNKNPGSLEDFWNQLAGFYDKRVISTKELNSL